MVLANLSKRTFRGRRWAPSAVNVLRDQRRHNTPYMPWPFDTYAYPGAAKYWISKAPPTDWSQDEYDQELLYLDELEERVANAHKNYTPSTKWKTAYNEFAWEDHNSVVETYGNIGGVTSPDLIAKYGRGQKIDPTHYINPRFEKHDRVAIESPYINQDLKKRAGPLRNFLALPPEEPSVFKLWNPWTMFGATSIVLLSKEWFLISHDFWHGHMFWTAWALICTVCVDWWTWYYVLRGQELYDMSYFPLNEQTEELFARLDQLDKRPPVAGIFAAIGTYAQGLGARMVEKKKNDMIALANIKAAEKLSVKAKEESSHRAQALSSFKENSFQATMQFFTTAEAQKKYMDATLEMMSKNAELKPGVAEVKTESTTFAEKYKSLYGQVEKDYYATKRKEGTLPWALATEEEIKQKRMSAAEKQKLYADQVETWAKKYHPVTQSVKFA